MNGNTQVSATELNLLPIPLGEYESDIARIAKRIQRTKTDSDRNKLVKELNKAVAMAYGLNARELEYKKNISVIDLIRTVGWVKRSEPIIIYSIIAN